ncbi:MAG: sphingosine kinase, partial [Acidobacteria bacterium]|nr:sphingosine kinase [Acidobacteriota bacterium]
MTVILNPSSGPRGTADLRERVTATFSVYGIQARIEQPGPGAPLAAAARRAIAGGERAVVAGGGDGTISSVAAALAGSGAALGVLPLGTLNHFAKDLGIPLDLDGAVRTIARGHSALVDVGEVNGRVFL